MSRQGRLLNRLVLSLVSSAIVVGFAPAVAFSQPSSHPFELEPESFEMSLSNYQAGAHADWRFSFNVANEAAVPKEASKTYNDLKDAAIDFPAGFTANNTAVPTCTFERLLGKAGGASECPAASQVGTISVDLDIGQPERITVPVYNMEVTSYGVVAELGFRTAVVTQVLPVYVRPQDNGITGTSPSVAELGEPHEVSFTIWGEPAAHEHDPERGLECFARGVVFTCEHGGEEANVPLKAYLSNPTSCGMFTAGVKADSWEEPQPAGWLTEQVEPGMLGQLGEVGPIVGCERVPFHPSLEVQPTTRATESPTGLNVALDVPQTWDEPGTISTANLKDTTLTLPVGVTLNPSAGSGLGSCTPVEYAAETASSPPGAGCPPESKIGSIEIETPLLAEKIDGAVYVATPYDNPFGNPEHPGGSLLALYIVAKSPARGILVKVAGRVSLDPVTGQLTSTFENTPQQAFSRFTLEFRPGQTAPLVSPPACGTYSAQAELTPWSAKPTPFSEPGVPAFLNSAPPFETTEGVHGGPCPSGGVPPFAPQVVPGAQNSSAGAYTPFYLRVLREDGEQEITKFTTILPPGLSANLSGIPFCPDAAIEAARTNTGQNELAHPSCPQASEIGHTLVGAGVGSVLAWTPGRVYLAGPYHGSALSIVSITSAAVGPFDLGTVVIRFALRINPTTAQAEIDSTGSDPIPHIIDGIVVHVRDIHVYIDRPKFVLDPTNCDPLSILDTIAGAGADPSNPADQSSDTVDSHFQAADCANLGFAPSFKASTSGKTSRREGASLTVKLTYPVAPSGTQANIHSVKVSLPKQLPSRLTTLQKACADSVFIANPASCPAASRVGTARAITPILPEPLTGPAYFVSHGGAGFPELVLVLQGYGVTIDLHGETFISKAGITSSTFRSVPDEPVQSFVLTLPEGPDSALAANGNLCKSKLKMPTAFVAQNGATIHKSTPIAVNGCPKHVAKARSKRAKRKR